jgi:multiple sugar transport system substrate-binding protein
MAFEASKRQIDALQTGAVVSRRRFLVVSVSGLAAGVLTSLVAACGPSTSTPAPAPAATTAAKPAATAAPAAGATTAAKPAAGTTPAAQAAPGGFTGGGSVKVLMRSHFVPAYDTWFDKWADDWGAKNKVTVEHDHILSGQLPPKLAAEFAASAGHDIYVVTRSADTALYSRQLLDVSDIAKQIGEARGGWIPFGEQVGLVEGTWKSLPEYFIDFPQLYRKDIFDDNGLKPVDTWDDLLKSGTILKNKGNRLGICINQGSNDALNSWHAILWCHGAATVDKDGKTVTLNSPQTKEALAYGLELYQKTMTNEVLSWDDNGNNLLLYSGTGSWIHNPISALRTMEKETPDLAKKIAVGPTPAGPAGRHILVGTNAYAISSWTSNAAAAKAFMVDYFNVITEGIKVSEGYNQPFLKDLRKKPMPILGEDPRLNILQDFDQVAHAAGWPGPANTAAGEAEANFIVPLMVGRAVQDGNINSAVEWATQKLEAIYAKR